MDTRAHLSDSTEEFFEDINTHGLKAALKKRHGVFGDGRARVVGPEIRDAAGNLID
jgi:enoyl-CoA hydratase